MRLSSQPKSQTLAQATCKGKGTAGPRAQYSGRAERIWGGKRVVFQAGQGVRQETNRSFPGRGGRVPGVAFGSKLQGQVPLLTRPNQRG